MKKETKSSSSKALNIQPLGDRVVVRPQEAGDMKTASGFIIPDTARKEKPERGEVVAVGEGRRTDRGEIIPMRVQVGDVVMFDKYGFSEFKIGDTEYYVVKESDILAIIK